MFRTFGLQTITGTNAQPLFGDKITVALPIPPAGIDSIVTVANTAIYQTGDRINIEMGTANQDTLLVTTILTGTTMQCTSQGGAAQHAHAINSLISLSIPCAEIIVQLMDATTANAVLGSDSTVTTAPGGNLIQILYKTASGTPTVPFRFTNSVAFNTIRTDDAWIIGTANDKFIAVAEIV
jgi:hypothetical protein